MEHCVRRVVPLFSSPSSPPTVILCKPATIITANYGSRCQQLYRSTRAGHTVEENAEEGDEGRQMAHFISAQYRSEVRPKGWSSLIQTLRKSSKHIIINHSTCWCLFLIILCYNKIYIYFFFQYVHLVWTVSQSALPLNSHSTLTCGGDFHLCLANPTTTPTATPPSSVQPHIHWLTVPPSRHQYVDTSIDTELPRRLQKPAQRWISSHSQKFSKLHFRMYVFYGGI